MSEANIQALRDLRDAVVEERRKAAGRGDAKSVVTAQSQIVTIDEAIADERALSQAQKDQETIERAIRRAETNPSPPDIGDVTIYTTTGRPS